MPDIELITRAISAGAVGVAALALYLWHKAYSELLQYASRQADHSELKLNVLAAQLKSYQNLVLIALVISAGVQIGTSLLERTVILRMSPVDESIKNYLPNVSKNGKVLILRVNGDGMNYEEKVSGVANFDISFLRLRDRIRDAENIALTSAKSQAERHPGMGPDKP